MKICKIKWSEHPVLGNLLLNLTKDDGTPYDTIVLAGENGSGKTAILHSLYRTLEKHPMDFIEYIEYSIEDRRFQARPDSENARFGFYHRLDLSSGDDTLVMQGRGPKEKYADNPLEFRNYGHIYSSARSGFNTKSIKSTTTSQLDSENTSDDENLDYTEIKQLFVDLQTQDDRDLRETVKKAEEDGIHIEYSEFYSTSRIRRFSKAFDDFFGGYLTYHGDQGSSNEIVVQFAKGSRLVNIDDLSTGEKQVVFRGAYCLRNMKTLKGGVVLIDEPELSMHPKWQMKILDYYRQLFSEDGVQTAQLIIATHSQHVLSSALDSKDIGVIILSNEGETIQAKDAEQRILPYSAPSEVHYAAFGIVSEEYLLALFCHIQEFSGHDSVESADKYILDCLKDSEFQTKLIKEDEYRGRRYYTLPTFIRNAICHPNSNRKYARDELSISIQMLRYLCLNYSGGNLPEGE